MDNCVLCISPVTHDAYDSILLYCCLVILLGSEKGALAGYIASIAGLS